MGKNPIELLLEMIERVRQVTIMAEKELREIKAEGEK